MKNQLNSMVRAALLQAGNIKQNDTIQNTAVFRTAANLAESRALAIASRKAELSKSASIAKRKA